MKRIHNKGAMLFTGLILSFTLVMVLTALLSYEPKPGSVPLLIGIPTLIMSIIVIIGEVYPKLLKGLDVSLMDLARGASGREARSEKAGGMKTGGGLVNISLWIVAFFLLIYLVGFLIAIAAVVLLLLKVRGKVGWIKTLVVTAVVWGLIFGIMEIMMKVELFRGILFGAFVPSI